MICRSGSSVKMLETQKQQQEKQEEENLGNGLIVDRYQGDERFRAQSSW